LIRFLKLSFIDSASRFLGFDSSAISTALSTAFPFILLRIPPIAVVPTIPVAAPIAVSLPKSFENPFSAILEVPLPKAP